MGFDPEHYRIVKEASEKGERVELENAQLENAQLKGANLRGCNLLRSNLQHANLEDADLESANLQASDLDNANLVSAILRGAKLVGSTFKNSCLRLADLENADLALADFDTADLNRAKMLGAELRKTSFRNANLYRAKITGLIINESDFSFSNFRETGIHRVQFRWTNMSGANFQNADLVDVGFFATNLNQTEFDEAEFGRVRIDECDLSKSQNLNTVSHSAKSYLGFDTLVNSGGKIPKVFLQGCGLPDSYIDYIPSLIGSLNPIDFYSCFISYSHKDKSFATRLHNDLQAKGIRCWLDDKEMKMGDDIYAKVDRGIRLWDKVILCASMHSLDSGWVEREVETAIEMELKHRKETGDSVLKIIPLNLDGSLFDWTGSHAATLRKRLAGDFVDWDKDNEKYESQFKRLVDALNNAPEQDPPPQKLFKK